MHHSRRIACICSSLGMLLLLGQMPADAAQTDNAVTQNAITNNAITNNAVTQNALAGNAVTQNAMNANAITTNGVAASGPGSALAELNGVTVEAATLPDQQHP